MAIGKTAAAALLLWGAAGGVADAGEPRGPVRLRVASIEIARIGTVSFELMQRELDSLGAEAGLRLAWRRIRPAAETRLDEVRVVFLDSPGRGAHAGRLVLGATRNGGPAPTIWIYTPTVVRALGLPVGAPLVSLSARRMLGIALGRVLAHELVHLLAPEVPHGHGLMADRLRLVALDQTSPPLPPVYTQALIAGVRAWEARGGTPGWPARASSASAALEGTGVAVNAAP